MSLVYLFVYVVSESAAIGKQINFSNQNFSIEYNPFTQMKEKSRDLTQGFLHRVGKTMSKDNLYITYKKYTRSSCT